MTTTAIKWEGKETWRKRATTFAVNVYPYRRLTQNYACVEQTASHLEKAERSDRVRLLSILEGTVWSLSPAKFTVNAFQRTITGFRVSAVYHLLCTSHPWWLDLWRNGKTWPKLKIKAIARDPPLDDVHVGHITVSLSDLSWIQGLETMVKGNVKILILISFFSIFFSRIRRSNLHLTVC